MSERRDIILGMTLRGLVLAITALISASIIAGIVTNGVGPGVIAFSTFACWMMAPGLVLWLHPRLSIAVLWSMLAWFGFLMAVNLPWPGDLAAYLMFPVLLVQLFFIPIGAALYQAMIVRADARVAKLAKPELPAARVVNRRVV